jgi:hypothetical protein
MFMESQLPQVRWAADLAHCLNPLIHNLFYVEDQVMDPAGHIELKSGLDLALQRAFKPLSLGEWDKPLFFTAFACQIMEI